MLTELLDAYKDAIVSTHNQIEFNSVGELDCDVSDAIAEENAARAKLEAHVAELSAERDGMAVRLAAANLAYDCSHAKVAELSASLTESNAVCVCGCPSSEHESYDSDGEACANEDHQCVRTSPAVLGMVQHLEAKVAELEARLAVATTKCRHCGGGGMLHGELQKPMDCPSCGGTGRWP